jgi:hypothetical protein
MSPFCLRARCAPSFRRTPNCILRRASDSVGCGWELTSRQVLPPVAAASRWFAVAVVSMVWMFGSPALATVEPPVKVRMPRETQRAVAGQPYSGVFEIHVGQAGTVDDISITGEGWTIQQVDRPAGPRRMHPGVLRIPFRAVPADADRPIRLSLTYEGRRITQTYEIGPAYFNRAGRSRPLERIPGTTGLQQAPGDGLEALQAEEPPPEARATGAFPPGRRLGAQSHLPPFVTVVGRVVYTRPDGRTVGAPRSRRGAAVCHRPVAHRPG